jgi:hypothetical protein
VSLATAIFPVAVFVVPYQVSGDTLSADGVYATGYFGDTVSGLSEDDSEAFARGLELFVRRWDSGSGHARNAASCVSCHSVPMPGGSGMSDHAVVTVRMTDAGTEVIQREELTAEGRSVGGNLTRRRSPPLFGIGFIEFAEERMVGGTPQPIFGIFGEERSLKRFVARAFATELGVSNSMFCARDSASTPYPHNCQGQIKDTEISDVVSFLRF